MELVQNSKAIITKVSTKKTRKMGLEFTGGRMEQFTKESFKMMRKRAKGF